ncbi:metal ABC transporter permease [Enterococcus faecalis]
MIANFIDGLLRYQFLQNALVTSVIVGVISGIIGSFIILRGMSLMGDAISHAVLPGVAASYILGTNYIIGASLFGILAALLIGLITQKSPLKNDTAIGVVFSSFFALGIILISFAKSSTDLYHILFGNVLAVRESDIVITSLVGLLVFLFVGLFYKELKVTSFDPIMAQAYGLSVQFFHYALMFLLTLVAVTSLQTVGTILVIAMLITPAATAFLLTNHLGTMIALAAFFGVISSVIGLFFSYSYNLASGATIVLTAAAFFLLAFLFSPRKGLVFINKQKKNKGDVIT